MAESALVSLVAASNMRDSRRAALPQRWNDCAHGLGNDRRRAIHHWRGDRRWRVHFHPALLSAPHGAFSLNAGFFEGLGTATLLATYDYWGYYTVCFLGGEVKQPERTIPRAVLWSIVVVAILYLSMNVSVAGVIPMAEMTRATTAKFAVVAVLMERTFGGAMARVLALLVMWTAFASVFSLLLAYSRAPYAAAADGNYFRAFARLHPKHRFPNVSLLALGAVATLFCFFNLSQVIAALVAIRILLQYVLQQIGVIVLRVRRPEMSRPFRMWLYPLPPLLALGGFLFILFSRPDASREMIYAAGCGAYRERPVSAARTSPG